MAATPDRKCAGRCLAPADHGVRWASTYRFIGEDRSSSGRWEIWCDSLQSQAIRAAQAGAE